MAALETQVGQIFINNKKLSKSFISLFSEKAAETGAEVFILAEAALLNPAASSEYEKILKSIASIVRRNYKKPNPNAFENAVAQVNEDLAGIAGQGQTSWVGRLNACIAVRENESLAVATTGKIHAYLFRDKQFSDIADAGGGNTKQNPLKAFENFAIGKVAKKDFLIFTTNQLFNYVSIERLQKILGDLPIAAACKTVADLIKQLADESISFGTFVVELGSAKDFSAEEAAKALNVLETKKVFARIKTGLAGAKSFAAHTMLVAKKPSAPKINIQAATAEMLKSQPGPLESAKNAQSLSRAKKFFFGAALIFLVLLAINIILALRVHNKKQTVDTINTKLTDIQQKINDANAAFIYNDQKTASDLFNSAQQEFNTLPLNDKSIADQANKISTELTALENSVEHVRTAATTTLFTANSALDAVQISGGTLYAVNFQGDLFMPYSLSQNQQQPNFTVSAPAFSNIAGSSAGLIATDQTGSFYQIDLKNKTAVKQPGNLIPGGVGLAAYGSPLRLYTLKKDGSAIMVANLLSTPVNYMPLNNSDKPLDLAIDGSIYILYPDKILKFNAKQPKSFNAASSFSQNSKIYTAKGLSYAYVLDPDRKKFMILSKDTGAIQQTYSSAAFHDLKNFTVDEKSRTAYIIDGQSVLSMHY